MKGYQGEQCTRRSSDYKTVMVMEQNRIKMKQQNKKNK